MRTIALWYFLVSIASTLIALILGEARARLIAREKSKAETLERLMRLVDSCAWCNRPPICYMTDGFTPVCYDHYTSECRTE